MESLKVVWKSLILWQVVALIAIVMVVVMNDARRETVSSLQGLQSLTEAKSHQMEIQNDQIEKLTTEVARNKKAAAVAEGRMEEMRDAAEQRIQQALAAKEEEFQYREARKDAEIKELVEKANDNQQKLVATRVDLEKAIKVEAKKAKVATAKPVAKQRSFGNGQRPGGASAKRSFKTNQ